jgi:hypothetical protein
LYGSKLSEAIKEDSASIRRNLPPIHERTVAIHTGVVALSTDTRYVKDGISSIRRDLVSLQANTRAIKHTHDLQHHNAVTTWLSQTDFPVRRYDILSRRQDGTVHWFLESQPFRRWLGRPTDGALELQDASVDNKTLFCPGIPGAGKTVIAAVTVDYLYSTFKTRDTGIGCIFCSYKAQSDQSLLGLVAALLKQLTQSRLDIAAPVRDLHARHEQQRTKAISA